MLHLHVSIKGVTKISPPPSPTTTTTMAMRDEVRGEVVRLMICSYAKLQESHCIFTDKRNLYKHRYRDTPTPPPKLGSNLPPPPPRHLKIRLVRPSLTLLGHHALLMWQNWLIFTVVFSVTSIYLENATTPPPKYKITPSPP